MVVDLLLHSAFTSATRSEPYTHGHHEARARQFYEAPPMAAATLLNPATGYHPHSQPFSSPYHHPQPPLATTNMIPHGDSKRLSTEIENGPRQSLPSISEVLKPSHYTPVTPTTLPGSQSLPPPFASVGPPLQQRPEPGPEPRPLPTREEKHYRYHSRHNSGPAQGVVPQSSYSYPEHGEMSKAPEPNPSSSHLNSQPPSMSYPPGQLPLSATSATVRHSGPLPPYDIHRPPPPPRADDEYGMHRPRYDATLNRHFEAWGYADCLGKVCNVQPICLSIANR